MAARRRKVARAGAAMAASAVLDPQGREVWPDVATHPGVHLAEMLEAKGWTQVGLARRMGRPVQVVNEIIRGVKGITPETAMQLGHALNMSESFWWRLEANYRFTLARITAKNLARMKRQQPAAARRAAKG